MNESSLVEMFSLRTSNNGWPLDNDLMAAPSVPYGPGTNELGSKATTLKKVKKKNGIDVAIDVPKNYIRY